MKEDYIDFHVKVIDNGDDKVCLQGKNYIVFIILVHLGDVKTLNLLCSNYKPILDSSPLSVILAGSGASGTYLKEVSFKYVPR